MEQTKGVRVLQAPSSSDAVPLVLTATHAEPSELTAFCPPSDLPPPRRVQNFGIKKLERKKTNLFYLSFNPLIIKIRTLLEIHKKKEICHICFFYISID
jgi:hypothetical protein